MNYMKEVAKMLGVEIGEVFEIGPHHVEYVLSDCGLFNVRSHNKANDTFISLLTDGATIKRKPWKPNIEDFYYIIDESGQSSSAQWYDDSIDINYYKIGNCYKTREEAEANREKWKSFYESDEVLEI